VNQQFILVGYKNQFTTFYFLNVNYQMHHLYYFKLKSIKKTILVAYRQFKK